jgi:hypothetical protein
VNYTAKLLRVNTEIEEEVLLQIGGWELLCFAGICPYPIREGQEYSVALSFVVLDDYEVRESSCDLQPCVRSMGSGFAAELVGRLNGNRLSVGPIEFEDDVLLSDYGYLDGKLVRVKADRISAEFLSI